MKTLKFVFLMAVFMIVAVTVATSSQVNTTKDTGQTVVTLNQNMSVGGADYCWTAVASVDNTQIAVMVTVMPVNFVEVAENGSDLVMYGLTEKANKESASENSIYAKNQSKSLVDKLQEGGAQLNCPNYFANIASDIQGQTT